MVLDNLADTVSSTNNVADTSKNIGGVFAAIPTPFKATQEIDVMALEMLLEFLVQNGIDGIVACGTTGEALSLTLSEKEQVLRRCVASKNKSLPIIAGVMQSSTNMCIEEIKMYNQIPGIDAVMCVTPYYTRPTYRGIVKHYHTLADASAVPIVVYNNPHRTGIDINNDVLAEIFAHKNIIGIKECSPKIIEKLYALKKLGVVMSGNDNSAKQEIARGANGVISVVANIIPHLYKGSTNLAKVCSAIYAEPGIMTVKYALSKIGIMKPYTRLPYTEVSPSCAHNIDELLRELGML